MKLSRYFTVGLIIVSIGTLQAHPARPRRHTTPFEQKLLALAKQHNQQSSAQQLALLGSLAVTAYLMRTDIAYLATNSDKQHLAIKGLLAYATGKQLQQYASEDQLLHGAAKLLSYYGKTVVALLLIYG